MLKLLQRMFFIIRLIVIIHDFIDEFPFIRPLVRKLIRLLWDG